MASGVEIQLHLLSLWTAQPHPSAATPVLAVTVDGFDRDVIYTIIRVSGELIGLLSSTMYGANAISTMWLVNWKQGRLLWVRACIDRLRRYHAPY